MVARPTISRLLVVVLTKELREVLRDINTLLFSVLFPLLFFPGCVWLFTQVSAYTQGRSSPPRVHIVGDVPIPDSVDVTEAAVGQGPEDARASAERMGTGADDRVLITYRSTDSDSVRGKELLAAAVRAEWPIEVIDRSPPGDAIAAVLAKGLPVLLVLGSMIAALYPAVEAVIAERERGTVETTLVTPCPRWVFFAGKLGSVLLITLISLYANAFAVAVTLAHVVSLLDSDVALPLHRLAATLPIASAAAALIVALSLFVAVPTRSFKQAQNTTTALVTLLSIVALAGMAPSAELTLGWALIPLTNAVVVMVHIIEGRAVGLLGWLAGLELLALAALTTWGAARIAVREAVN